MLNPSKYYRSDIQSNIEYFGRDLAVEIINALNNKCDAIVFVFVGTDRSTGDCLGPLTGHLMHQPPNLNKLSLFEGYLHAVHSIDLRIFGTLAFPVHAQNLQDTIFEIYATFKKPFVIAVDASLGRKNNIECVTLGDGPLLPGLGVKKHLPALGNIHITGIVDSNHSNGQFILQTTRLSTVMQLSNFIAFGISYSFELIQTSAFAKMQINGR